MTRVADGDLPNGWVRATLRELAVEAQVGFPSGRHNKTGDGIIHLRPMNVTRDGRISTQDARFVEDESDRRVTSGDVLFNNTNSPELTGKTALVTLPSPAAYSNHMTRLRPPEELDSGFLAAQLHTLWMNGYFKSVLSNHVNQASVATKKLLETPIVLPPLAEQRRIVAVLDDQLSRVDAATSTVISSGRKLLAWESAYLLATTVDHPDAGTWKRATVGELAKVSTGATPTRSRSDYHEGGTIPWVTSTLLNEPYVDRAEHFITEKALAETSVKLFPPGTLLVAMYGEGKTRGKCSELRISATTNQACAAIQVHPDHRSIIPWIKLVLEATYDRNRRLASGGVQPNLNLSMVRNIEIPIPPVDDLRAALEEVDRQRSLGKALQVQLGEIRRTAGALRRSLLSAAFSGRLVPQDPNDEPAAALLRRITAERGVGAKAKNSGRTTTSPTTTSKISAGIQEELPL